MVELVARGDAEAHLWRHRLYVEDVYAVLDEGAYKVFLDSPYDGRLKIIGTDRGRRLLSIIVTEPDKEGRSYLITAWPADAAERTMYERPGGRANV